MYMYVPTRLRHGRPNDITSVFNVDIQPNGMHLASCAHDCAIKLWDMSVVSAQTTHQQKKGEEPAVTGASASASTAIKKMEKLKSQIPPPGAANNPNDTYRSFHRRALVAGWQVSYFSRRRLHSSASLSRQPATVCVRSRHSAARFMDPKASTTCA